MSVCLSITSKTTGPITGKSRWLSGQRDGLQVHGSGSSMSLNYRPASNVYQNTLSCTVAARLFTLLNMFHTRIKSVWTGAR